MSVEHVTDPVCETWSLDTSTGLRVCVPPSMRSLSTYVLLEQERWLAPELTLLPRLLRPGMQVLDIGAGHGLYALEMARCLPAGQVWAFEPSADARVYLQRSIQVNGLGPRITLVDAALGDSSGARAVDGAPVVEGSGRGSLRPDPISLLSLDECLGAKAKGVAIDFVRLGVGGQALQVLDGARQFLSLQSPVLMFQLRHGPTIHTALVERLQVLGYQTFRWSAELKLLLPFDVAVDETALVLNLLALRPAQQLELAARGLLVTAAQLQAVAEPTPDPRALEAWCALSEQSLGDLPLPISAADLAYLRALNAVASAHLQPELNPAERVALMVSARNTLLPVLDSTDTLGPEAWTLIVHGLHALGQQQAAVQMAGRLLARWPQQQALRLPFVPPQVGDLDRQRSSDPASWLRQVLGEFVAMRGLHSSYCAPPEPERWAQLLVHPDHSAEVERRYMLAHMVQDRVASLAGLSRLPGADATCNPELWCSLLQATRAMGRDEGSVPRSHPSLSPVDALLATLPVATVHIVDVGASSLGPDTEPYAPLLRAGRGRVTGFEPDEEALNYLQQHFPNPHTHRFLPSILGDGQPAVFHETEWAMTASLLEPNRAQLDRYHQLGSLVRERARHRVHTVRLDEMIEAGCMDVLKIDVQGAEGLVFAGASQRLDECLVVWTEVEFVPLYREQPLFGDIDARLRRHGLQFLCFAGIAQRALASWPQAGVPGPQRQQQLWADAVFVPQPERIETMAAPAAARLALIAHHMLAAQDLCHAALQRLDRCTGSNYAVRYLNALAAA